MPSRPFFACLAALTLVLAPAVGVASPVDGRSEALAPDPYELAARWTLASLNPDFAPPLASVAETAPVPRFTPLPHLAGGDLSVPDPGAYALMGAALLVAGLLARRLAAGQRGFSKAAA